MGAPTAKIRLTSHANSQLKSPMRESKPRLLLTLDIKRLWLDPPEHTKRIGTSGAEENASMLKFFITQHLPLGKDARILEVGAFNNSLADSLAREGYLHAEGIDLNPEILGSPRGRRLNLRDLDIHETFNAVCFSSLLEYVGGGAFNPHRCPSMELFAWKVNQHVKPGGFIVCVDEADLMHNLNSILQQMGYISLKSPTWVLRIWQKR